MEQVERIRTMEEVLQRAKAACRALEHALADYGALRDGVKALGAYYGSELWFYDLDCDRAGLLPAELKRGVLSEDEAYDLLSDWDALEEQLRELAGDTRPE